MIIIMKFARASFAAFLVVILSLATIVPAFAANISYQLSSRFEINANNSVEVEQNLTATHRDAEPSPQSLTVPLAGTDITDLEASYVSSGEAIEVNTKTAVHKLNGAALTYTEATLELPRNFRGVGRTWTVKITYTAEDIYVQRGDIGTLNIAPLPYTFDVSQTTLTLISDRGVGMTTVRGAEPADTSLSLGEQRYDFVFDGAIKKPIVLSVGSKNVATVSFKQKLQNDSWWWKTVTLPLPPDTNQQRIYLENLSPRPTNLTLDRDGNILAQYRIRPQGSVDVTAKVTVVINALTYNIDTPVEKASVPEVLEDRYVKPNQRWGKSILKKPGFKEVDQKASVINITRGMFDAAVALEADADKSSDSLVAALRASGLPARLVKGVILSNDLQQLKEPKAHTWVEVFIPAEGWMTLDPAFGRYSESFGRAGAERVALVIMGGESIIEPVSPEKIEFPESAEVPEQDTAKTKFEAQNFMIIPLVNVIRTAVTMPPGIIYDDTGIVNETNGRYTPLGSLAPLQRKVSWQLALGPSTFETQELVFGVGLDTVDDEFKTAKAPLDFVPMAIGVVVLGAIFILSKKLHHRVVKPIVRQADNSREEREAIEKENLLRSPSSTDPQVSIPPNEGDKTDEDNQQQVS